MDSATLNTAPQCTDGSVEIPLGIELTYDRTINLAMQQNAIPVIKLLTITNSSDSPLQNITVRIALEPELSKVFERQIAEIDAHSAHTYEAPDIGLLPERLVNLVEREKGLIKVEVCGSGFQAVSVSWPVEILAFNEWNGVSSLPELIAAFVLPNHPAVEEILTLVRANLVKWSCDPAITGYQSKNPKLILLTAAAVYAAIQELGITYVSPSASFEKTGQKIRLPEQLLSKKMGTCLDLTVLIASCLEQAGLHPIITINQGHAYPGVWLSEGTYSEAVVDEPLMIKKRVEVFDICMFDSSAVTVRPPVSFEAAQAKALEYLSNSETFIYAVDIKAARNRGMRPLPIRITEGGYGILKDSGSGVAGEESFPISDESIRLMTDGASPGRSDESFSRRFERWTNKLLDLSLRNRLLNFRPGAKTLPIVTHSVAVLEDGLAANTTYELCQRPGMLTGRDPRDAELYKAREGSDLISEFLGKELEQKRLYIDLDEKELNKRLTEIWRSARTSIEETGSNILYLTLGFVAWYETQQSTEKRLAPILLLPVELLRGSVRDPFKIRIAEEEVRINITLLQKLKVDFGLDTAGLDEMPEDQSGYDIPRIFQSFRRAILKFDRWELLEGAHLGLFWFSKFLMWTDLQSGSNELMDSPMLKTLISGCCEGSGESPFIPSERIDMEKDPGQCLCPVDADSSQLAAVYASEKDQSFVIVGPPGTGKSQTITNIIAHTISQGKTVLFVAEKMAALNVVYQRLKKSGLSPFCLELHSTKTHKSDIIRQFQEALDVARYSAPGEWKSRTAELQKLRAQLNDYLMALHRPRLLGKSVFQVQAHLVSLTDVSFLPISISAPEAVDGEFYRSVEEEVERLGNYAQLTGSPLDHPLRAVGLTAYDAARRMALDVQMKDLFEALQDMKEKAHRFASVFGIPEAEPSYANLCILADIAGLLKAPHVPTERIIGEKDWTGLKSRIEKWIVAGKERNAIWGELSEQYDRKLIELDLDELRILFSRWSGAFFIQSFLMLFASRRRLSKVSLKKLPANKEILVQIEKALTVRNDEQQLTGADGEGRSYLGALWNGSATDWDKAGTLIGWAENYRRQILRITERYRENSEAIAAGFHRYVCEDNTLSGGGQGGAAAGEFCESFKQVRAQLEKLAGELNIDAVAAWGGDEAQAFIRTLEKSLTGWIENRDRLRDWCSYRKALVRVAELGLAPLGNAHFNGTLPASDLINVFHRSFYEIWLNAVTKTDPLLAEFHGAEQNRKIARFRSIDRQSLTIVRQYILAALSAKVPAANGNVVGSSDLGTLQREIQKKKRHMSIRKLLLEIRNLIPRLKPCFLMSPLSVAQYLARELPAFDLVVFDEASQVPIWDALGALARGKKAVVVGDPRQLPPTAFFSRGDSGDETEEDFEELESILDECRACALPSHTLKWHYRSRHEHLIAFSNFHYYASLLHTFPSAGGQRLPLGVSFRHIKDGFYDKGASRTNRKEAEEVISEIVTRLRNPEESRRSIGVVTFSQPQQSLIEDLLDEARRNSSEIEPFFTDAVAEPVFVKNLENVQGDERDVMLFSIGYGPDRNGKVSVNFGPLNQKGGERRLNVAITRAREQIVVFSTLTADMIDLRRTGAIGVTHLRSFLDFAVRGPKALQGAITLKDERISESLFEEEVGKALEELGWAVCRQVGCSGFRIDLAVVDPDRLGSFLLGIECDGAGYHSSRCARDRDRLRHEVLENLGWKIHHIWSTDWWHNRAKELEKVIQALEEAKSSKSADITGQSEVSMPDSAVTTESETDRTLPQVVSQTGQDREIPLCAAISQQPADFYLYYPTVPPFGNQDIFFRADQKRTLMTRLRDIVDYESPICRREASRRLIALWGISKLGTRIQNYIDEVIGLALRENLFIMQKEILWRKDHSPDSWSGFRVPHPDALARREMEDIPPMEIANAAFHILQQCIALPSDDLIRQAAKLFGFSRMGTRVSECGQKAIALLAEEGRCTIEDGRVIIKE
ncbi:MAG: DUF3320 domain-containing protein [Vulcanimicrobiota bacterium]